MKIKTNVFGLEIEIKAKGLHEERANKQDTMAFVNWLSGIASNAAHNYETKGWDALQKEAEDFADLLFNTLDEKGYYDNIR